jgi:hypothetical protein
MREPVTSDQYVLDLIVETLCGQALADHLGDIRDEEVKLWHILGVDLKYIVRNYSSPWKNTRATLEKFNIPLPKHLQGRNGDGT